MKSMLSIIRHFIEGFIPDLELKSEDQNRWNQSNIS